MDGPLPGGGQTLIRSRQQGLWVGDDRRIDRRSARGDSRFVGQAVPDMVALVGGPEEVVVDLPGDVTLQAADDPGLGFALFDAPLDVELGGRVGAEAGRGRASFAGAD